MKLDRREFLAGATATLSLAACSSGTRFAAAPGTHIEVFTDALADIINQPDRGTCFGLHVERRACLGPGAELPLLY